MKARNDEVDISSYEANLSYRQEDINHYFSWLSERLEADVREGAARAELGLALKELDHAEEGEEKAQDH